MSDDAYKTDPKFGEKMVYLLTKDISIGQIEKSLKKVDTELKDILDQKVATTKNSYDYFVGQRAKRYWGKSRIDASEIHAKEAYDEVLADQATYQKEGVTTALAEKYMETHTSDSELTFRMNAINQRNPDEITKFTMDQFAQVFTHYSPAYGAGDEPMHERGKRNYFCDKAALDKLKALRQEYDNAVIPNEKEVRDFMNGAVHNLFFVDRNYYENDARKANDALDHAGHIAKESEKYLLNERGMKEVSEIVAKATAGDTQFAPILNQFLQEYAGELALVFADPQNRKPVIER